MSKLSFSNVLCENLKHNVKVFLQNNSISVAQFEKQSRLSNSLVKKLLDGTITDPSINTIIKIANQLDCSTDELLGLNLKNINNKPTEKSIKEFNTTLYQYVCLHVLYYIDVNLITVSTLRDIELIVSEVYEYMMSNDLTRIDQELLEFIVSKYISEPI